MDPHSFSLLDSDPHSICGSGSAFIFPPGSGSGSETLLKKLIEPEKIAIRDLRPPDLHPAAMCPYFATLVGQVDTVLNRNLFVRRAHTKQMVLSTVRHMALDAVIVTINLYQITRTGRNVEQFIL